jgi:hypothetical protein
VVFAHGALACPLPELARMGGDYDPTSATFAPDKAGTPNCGHACHVAVKTKDYVFHPYQMR